MGTLPTLAFAQLYRLRARTKQNRGIWGSVLYYIYNMYIYICIYIYIYIAVQLNKVWCSGESIYGGRVDNEFDHAVLKVRRYLCGLGNNLSLSAFSNCSGLHQSLIPSRVGVSCMLQPPSLCRDTGCFRSFERDFNLNMESSKAGFPNEP